MYGNGNGNSECHTCGNNRCRERMCGSNDNGERERGRNLECGNRNGECECGKRKRYSNRYNGGECDSILQYRHVCGNKNDYSKPLTGNDNGQRVFVCGADYYMDRCYGGRDMECGSRECERGQRERSGNGRKCGDGANNLCAAYGLPDNKDNNDQYGASGNNGQPGYMRGGNHLAQ